jgi:hypothetical protein
MSSRMIGVLVAALSWQALNGEEPKCDNVRPLDKRYGYAARGNRCEGLYVAEVGAPVVELLSLTKGPIAPYVETTKLKISPPPGSGPLYIRALAKPAGTYYRMDAKVERGKTFTWPVDEILWHEHIYASNLAVVAWRIINQDQIFVPIQVAPEGMTTPAEPTIVTLRPTFDADAVQWRHARLNDGACQQPSSWQEAHVDLPVLSHHAIEISMPGSMSGLNCLDFSARSSNTNLWSSPLHVLVELPSQ